LSAYDFAALSFDRVDESGEGVVGSAIVVDIHFN
jgi:hypothetical protein